MATGYRKLQSPPADLVHVPGGSHPDAGTPEHCALRENAAITKWSGATPEIPALGAEVTVTMNGIGTGTVEGYFAEHGWFGLLVRPHRPPPWYLKQNGPMACHVFGNEMRS